MSPDEFAAHPAAIFHSTYLPDEDVFNVSKRSPVINSEITSFKGTDKEGNPVTLRPIKKVHLGTFHAALQITGIRNSGDDKPSTIHTFWQTPKVSDSTARKRIANYITPDPKYYKGHEDPEHEELDINHPEAVAHFIPGTQYYENMSEDRWSPSLATDNPQKYLTSQADYVKTALDRGVPESEIHPRTLAQYKAGTLGKMEVTPAVAELMVKHWDKLGPYTHAGPTWTYLSSKDKAPERPERN